MEEKLQNSFDAEDDIEEEKRSLINYESDPGRIPKKGFYSDLEDQRLKLA